MAETTTTQAVATKAPARPISLKSFYAIEKDMLNRKLTNDFDGELIDFLVMGDGNDTLVMKTDDTIAVDDNGVEMMKRIFNTNVCSATAIVNPINRKMRADGIAAAEAGDMQLSYDLLQGYLNKIRVSFNVLITSTGSNKLIDVLHDRVPAQGIAQLIKTDNGSLFTIDAKSISVRKAKKFGKASLLVEDKANEEVILEDAKV